MPLNANVLVFGKHANLYGEHNLKLPLDPSRRRILILTAGAIPVGLVAASTSGCSNASKNDRQLIFTSLDDALNELIRMTHAEALKPATAWSWSQTLNHCAQSIEYSMAGFPQLKSSIFQRTVGKTAFNVFAARGRMSHNIGEPIPGAPLLDPNTDIAMAVSRLKQAVLDFKNWKQALQPHFAYGTLSKATYEQAHAMH